MTVRPPLLRLLFCAVLIGMMLGHRNAAAAPAANDANQYSIHLCASFDHDEVIVTADGHRVYSARITTDPVIGVAGFTTAPMRGSALALRIEVPKYQALLEQTIDPKHGRFLLVEMDRNHKLTVLQRKDRPGFD